MVRTITISWKAATRRWPARCAPRSRSTRARPMRCPRPRVPWAARSDPANKLPHSKYFQSEGTEVQRTDIFMTVAIVDYGSGNLRSAAKAFERAAAEAGTSAAITVTADADAVR